MRSVGETDQRSRFRVTLSVPCESGVEHERLAVLIWRVSSVIWIFHQVVGTTDKQSLPQELVLRFVLFFILRESEPLPTCIPEKWGNSSDVGANSFHLFAANSAVICADILVRHNMKQKCWRK